MSIVPPVPSHARTGRDERCAGLAADRHLRSGLARHMTANEDGAPVTGQDPGRVLLDKIEAREQALARQAEQARAQMEDLAARLRELDEAIDHLRITRRTLLSLAGEPAVAEPAEPPPVLPGHPAYQQILAVFADAGRPMRAPRPVPGPRPAHRAQEHREHPLQAQTPGQPRHPRRDRTGIVHAAAPVAQRRAFGQRALRNTNDERTSAREPPSASARQRR